MAHPRLVLVAPDLAVQRLSSLPFVLAATIFDLFRGTRPRRRFDYYNIGWIWFLTFGSQIRAHVDFDENSLFPYCGFWSGVSDCVQRFDAVDAVPSIRSGIVHDRGQNVGSANDVRLRELTFCCPRADSSRLFFLDCSDQLVTAAEQLPRLLAETPLLSDGGLGAKRLRKSCEIGYELMIVDERAFQRWGARCRGIVTFDVEARDAGV